MQIAKVQTKIGQITFKQITDTRFSVRCKGQPLLRIKQNRKTGEWVGSAAGVSLINAKNPKACYREMVKEVWLLPITDGNTIYLADIADQRNKANRPHAYQFEG